MSSEEFARITPDGIELVERTVSFEDARAARREAMRVRIAELFDAGTGVGSIASAVELDASSVYVFLGEIYLERAPRQKTMSTLGREYERVKASNKRHEKNAKRAAPPAAHPRPASKPKPSAWPSRSTPEPSEATRPNRQPAQVSAEYAAFVDTEPEEVTW